MTYKATYHLSADRIDRATLILTKLGLGRVIKEEMVQDEYGRFSCRQLTSTGVILVLDAEQRQVVTMWIASVKQVQGMWGTNHIPNWLYNVAVKNKKLAKMQDRG